MIMTRWLYNSDGDAIAFVQRDSVFSLAGDYVGKLEASQQVWNGDYIGEIFADDRLIYDARKLHENRRMPAYPGLPGFSGEPPFKGPATIPLGYHDVEIG
jgi:hypothetical protein